MPKKSDIDQLLGILEEFDDKDVVRAFYKSGVIKRISKSLPKPPDVKILDKVPRISPEQEKKWIESVEKNRKLNLQRLKKKKSTKEEEIITECILKLQPGWNLISIPLVPVSTGFTPLEDLIPPYLTPYLIGWFWYNGMLASWFNVSTLPNNPALSYFIFNTTSTVITLIIRGTPVTTWTMVVDCNGWNMIGSVLCTPCPECYEDLCGRSILLAPSAGFRTNPPGCFVPLLYKYSSAADSYVEYPSLDPFVGYFALFGCDAATCSLTVDMCALSPLCSVCPDSLCP